MKKKKHIGMSDHLAIKQSLSDDATTTGRFGCVFIHKTYQIKGSKDFYFTI